MKKTIEQLEGRKLNLQKKLAELKSKCDAIAKRQRERKDIDAKSREDDVEFLRF